MNYQIDQSGKVEQTNKDTVVAYSNSKIGAVILTKKEKRHLQELFRRTGMPALFVDTTFAILIYLLIKNIPNRKWIVDIEYPGHTKIVEGMYDSLSKKTVDFHWKLIGKSSPAHDVAYKVYVGKLKIGKRITAEEIWKLAKKIAGGYLKTGLSPANRHSAPANKKR
jgi:hypothetical protein